MSIAQRKTLLPQNKKEVPPDVRERQLDAFLLFLSRLDDATKAECVSQFETKPKFTCGRAASEAAWAADEARIDRVQRANARAAANDASGGGQSPLTWAAEGAANEIQGQENMARFFFLPMFGYASPNDIRI